MDFLPKKRYEQLGQALQHIPEELSNIWLQCPAPSCGFVFKPPWLEKRPPLVPVKPNVGSGRWIPMAATLKCPLCKSDVSLELPVEKQRARYDWFGDEAFQDFRPSRNEYLLTYSLVGANRRRFPGVEEAVREFKATLLPSTPPDSWRLHMTKIWSGHKREKAPLFKEWDTADVQQFVNRFFDLIRSFDESFRIFNVSALYRQSTRKQRRLAERREVRHEAYSLLLLTVIDASTKNGVQPHFVFDSEKDREGAQVVHEWAQRAYEGSPRPQPAAVPTPSPAPAPAPPPRSAAPTAPEGDVNCSDFSSSAEAQGYLLPGDPYGLDADNDGQACDSLN